MKILQLTCISGGFDIPKRWRRQNVPEEYTLERRLAEIPGGRREALYYKQYAFKLYNYDIFIWVDGKVQVTSPDFVKMCVEQLGDHDLAHRKMIW